MRFIEFLKEVGVWRPQKGKLVCPLCGNPQVVRGQKCPKCGTNIPKR